MAGTYGSGTYGSGTYGDLAPSGAAAAYVHTRLPDAGVVSETTEAGTVLTDVVFTGVET